MVSEENMDNEEQAEDVVYNTIEQEPYQLTLAEIEAARLAAYQAEADPLFFRWQRDEGDKQAWLDKIEEIKARFKKPEEVPHE
jgi:hypothetical protein